SKEQLNSTHYLIYVEAFLPAFILQTANGMTVTSWIGLSQSHLHFI
ncbi:hypothetical protein HMPREF0662_02791, partial [Prevotella nigrescens F0103]